VQRPKWRTGADGNPGRRACGSRRSGPVSRIRLIGTARRAAPAADARPELRPEGRADPVREATRPRSRAVLESIWYNMREFLDVPAQANNKSYVTRRSLVTL